MKIISVELFPLSLKVAPGKDVLTELPDVVIKVTTDDGLVGIGETGCLSSWYRGETQGSVMAVIAEVLAPLALIGEDPTRIEYIVDKMDYLARDNYQAKMLVDMALHDLKGKIFNLPVHQLLGGAITDRVKIGWVSADRDPAGLAKAAGDAHRAGYRTLKVKVGQSGMSVDDEVKRLQAIRAAVGDDMSINLDANGAWGFEQAVASIEALARFKLGYIEQPLHQADYDGMARLRRRAGGIPIYADEGAQELKDLLDLARREAVDGFFLKLCKAGGLLKAKRFLSVARALHLPVIVGCMSGASIEAAAYMHFLASDPLTCDGSHDCGPPRVLGVYSTDEPHGMPDIGSPIPVYRDGCGFVPEGPGLGVTLNEELMLSQLTEGKAVVRVTDRKQARHDGYRAKLAV